MVFGIAKWLSFISRVIIQTIMTQSLHQNKSIGHDERSGMHLTASPIFIEAADLPAQNDPADQQETRLGSLGFLLSVRAIGDL